MEGQKLEQQLSRADVKGTKFVDKTFVNCTKTIFLREKTFTIHQIKIPYPRRFFFRFPLKVGFLGKMF